MKELVLLKTIADKLAKITQINGFNNTLKAIFINPKTEPDLELLPFINIVKLEAYAEPRTIPCTAPPSYRKIVNLALELWATADNYDSLNNAIYGLYEDVSKALYDEGVGLGTQDCSLIEMEITKTFSPTIGTIAIGMGILYQLSFIEDYALL